MKTADGPMESFITLSIPGGTIKRSVINLLLVVFGKFDGDFLLISFPYAIKSQVSFLRRVFLFHLYRVALFRFGRMGLDCLV